MRYFTESCFILSYRYRFVAFFSQQGYARSFIGVETHSFGYYPKIVSLTLPLLCHLCVINKQGTEFFFLKEGKIIIQNKLNL